MQTNHETLIVIDMGIDTHQEPVVYMRRDCHICRAEGFNSSSRVQLESKGVKLTATLNVIENDSLALTHIGLSRIAMERLAVIEGEKVDIAHAPIIDSLGAMRKKIYGNILKEEEIKAILDDISEHKYTDVEISSFLTACAGGRLSTNEIISLTRAMVACGKQLSWAEYDRVYDKHCIGGLPGNRTTPLVVAIASAAGLIIPKTSSRAITSPAGTADTMETLMNVNLSTEEIQRVVSETGACLAWGGAVNLSPADDLLIRIEKALNLDAEGQLIASVLSKKIAAGSTHVVIDIPLGETAKVRSRNDAERLADLFELVAEACGIHVRCVITDGSRPVGAGIGPAEEARDVLAVLQNQCTAPKDLLDRAVLLAAHLLDLSDGNGLEPALGKARELVESGEAWIQFQRIANAQGGMKVLPNARHHVVVTTSVTGIIAAIDNRKLARLAKLAGAPIDPSAGLRLHSNEGIAVSAGNPLFTLLSDSLGELDYAMGYYKDNKDMFHIREELS